MPIGKTDMTAYRLRLTPRSAFGSPLMGDTLFGQLCWAIRNRHGEHRLTELLEGYTAGLPFAVVSDAFPADHLPRPTLPSHCFDLPAGDRKAVKKRAWLPVEKFGEPVASWLQHCLPPAELKGAVPDSHPQAHNTLNRESGTTGSGEFAPYAMGQLWYGKEVRLDVYLIIDETRLSAADLQAALHDIGQIGFGRDASIGLGKFILENLESITLPAQAKADALLALAPSAPQGLDYDPRRSFYQPFTRFGRHGDIGVHLQGGPFKAPVLLAQTGAVFSPVSVEARTFVGQGLGGDGSLSKTIAATVHQGYAPALGIRLPPLSKDRS